MRMCMQSNKYLPGSPLFKSVLLFLFSTQVKLLESLETMDKESFDTKFGGVLTYTTVSLFFEFRNIPIIWEYYFKAFGQIADDVLLW